MQEENGVYFKLIMIKMVITNKIHLENKQNAMASGVFFIPSNRSSSTDVYPLLLATSRNCEIKRGEYNRKTNPNPKCSVFLM